MLAKELAHAHLQLGSIQGSFLQPNLGDFEQAWPLIYLKGDLEGSRGHPPQVLARYGLGQSDEAD